jgi:hypothetical protein
MFDNLIWLKKQRSSKLVEEEEIEEIVDGEKRKRKKE